MIAQEYFNKISDHLQTLLSGDEFFTADFQSEDSDFVRFNKSEVRQAGAVMQKGISLDLIEGKRHANGTISLTGQYDLDRPRIEKMVSDLREQRKHLPEDPYLQVSENVQSTDRKMENHLPDGGAAVSEIRQAGQGRDLVGIYASGGIHSGFANSLGQRNWYSNYSYNLDWSFYHQQDKAVKTGYAGFEWKPEEFSRKVNWASEQLNVLSHEPQTINPGKYRAYLAPAALYDIIGVMSWGGFGLKSHKTKQTPLLKMVTGEEQLNPAITIVENTKEGISPQFQEQGYLRPDQVTLINEGQYQDCLVSPRSGKEYGVATNGAGASESPESIDVAAGRIPMEQTLKELDTGIFINNVWYLNFSDRVACRTTGMTRFATFWVENGEIKAPLNVMRFDETIYQMLGSNLVGLTEEREMILDAGSYFRRATSSGRLPGVLVDDFTLTL
ncbi:MAG: metallopeptidase TldD-related protein [Planctomycetota bacterium]|nr:metallopeptidase TldD-related protein [Planctomycetota bacterium]